MVVQRKSMTSEVITAMRNGPGSLTKMDLTGGKGPCKNCRIFCEFEIPPGAGIGHHDHQEETEYYIILEGKASVDDNGTPVTVGPGDVVITGDGAAHSITNNGQAPVRMIAVVVTY